MILTWHEDQLKQAVIFTLEIPHQEMEIAYGELSRLDKLTLEELEGKNPSIADKILGLEAICRKIEQAQRNNSKE